MVKISCKGGGEALSPSASCVREKCGEARPEMLCFEVEEYGDSP